MNFPIICLNACLYDTKMYTECTEEYIKWDDSKISAFKHILSVKRETLQSFTDSVENSTEIDSVVEITIHLQSFINL